MEDPSRCPLYLTKEESSIHLLLECSFSKKTWQEVLMLSSSDIEIPENFKDLFSSWASLSPFALNKKALLKSAWMWIPKAFCWKIWLERNRHIFREEECSSSRVASKAIAMLGEALDAKPSLVNSRPLDLQEISWLSGFTTKFLTRSSPPNPCLSKWEVRLDEQEFLKWRSTLNDFFLFFDGASKGNSGQARGGGVILSPHNSFLSSFSWGLGVDSNNKAEAMALWQGLTQAQDRGITSISVFGDSRIIIKAMSLKKYPSHL